MKGKNLLYFIFILVLAMYFLNPSENKHRVKLGLIPDDVMIKSDGNSWFKYHNYYLFSTTADSTDKRLSIGVLGFVLKQ
jgi:hypothetical protein